MAFVTDIKASVSTSGLSLPFSIISIVPIIIGILLGLKDWDVGLDVTDSVLIFINAILWWVVVGLLIMAIGKALDIYIKEKKFAPNFGVVILSILGTGLLISGAVHFTAFALDYSWGDRDSILLRSLIDFVFGFSLTIVGMYLYRYVRDKLEKSEIKADWRQ